MVVVVVGNPKLKSRTRSAAEAVVQGLTGTTPTAVIEVAELGPALLGWGAPPVNEAKQLVRDADLVVFASPTFKATYTGLLKLFLDQFAAGELAGTPAVALMLGAGLQHALAPELSLRPVLAEIGASLPAPSLYLVDSEWDTGPALSSWLEVARPRLAPYAQLVT